MNEIQINNATSLRKHHSLRSTFSELSLIFATRAKFRILKMKIHHLLLILYLMSTLPFCATAQTGKFYSTDKELSNSLINKVYQDRKGFIWIATEDGLNKFDGNKFTIYKQHTATTGSLLNNYVKTVFEDSNGRFWVGCLNGVQLYERSTDTFRTIPIYHKGKKINPQIASNILERKNHEIWLGTYGQGIVTLQGDRFLPQEELNKQIQSYFIHSIYEDARQNIWIATEDRGLFSYSPDTRRLQHFTAPGQLSSDDVSCFCEDQHNTLFISTLNGGLMRYDATSQRFIAIPYKEKHDLSIKTLMVDNENNLYIGTEGRGVKQYDRLNQCIVDCDIHSNVFDLTSSKVHSILADNAGNLWLGIFQKGLLCIPAMQNKFNYYGYKSYLKSSIGSSCVMGICTDRHGTVWIGTDNDGLYAIDDNGKQLAHFKEENGNRRAPGNIMCVFEDSEQKFWVGSYFNGLAQVDKQTGICTYVSELSNRGQKANNEKIYCLIEDRNRNIWVSTYGSGIYKMSLSGKILEQHQSDKLRSENWNLDRLCNDWVNCMIEDSDGLLWIGTCNGLSCFNPATRSFINYFSKNNLLPNVFVHTLLQDQRGLIWVGTSEGLYRFDKVKAEFKKYTTAQGLPSDVICGIEQDAEGTFWISTHRGIAKLNPTTETFINYYASDGIQGNEFTRGAACKDGKGKIYFGGTGGVTSFYPKDITEYKKKLKVEITDFMLANHSIKKGDLSGEHVITDTLVMDASRFTLAYDHNSFSLEFSTMEYSNPERIIYQYKMQGLDADWMSTNTGVNRVTYTSLAPGKYIFQVRAKDDDNTSDVRTVEILITPPWYQSWWAMILWTLLGIAVVYSITMYILARIRHKQEILRREHLEQINEAKLQFFINISHEIRTPMTLIISPLEKLLAEHSDKQATYLMIYRNAQRILRLINQLMDIRKLDKGQMHLKFRETDIVGFIDDLMQTFEYQAQKKDIRFTFEKQLPGNELSASGQDSLKVWIDLNNFDKVLMNVLSNAFKYTPKEGAITVSLATGHQETVRGALKHYFEISVTDSGIGIDKDKIEQIFERFYQINNDVTQSNFGTGIGLHLSRSLVELHHGIIKAENRPDGTGTRFIIRLPLGSDHLKADELENPEELEATEGSTETTSRLSHTTLLPEEVVEQNSKKPKAKTRYRVLVVEDDDEIRRYICDELSGDFRLAECTNGREAIDYILREKPDLVISDVMMPEMDGIALCRKMKQNLNVSHIPVVLLTAKSKAEDRMEGLEIGADAYIVKPFNTELLRTTVSNLIANRERLKNKFSGEKHVEEQMVKIEMKSSDEILMQKVMKTINEHLADPALNVEMLAANVGMSRVHMHRKLKELANQSARDFIRTIRLKQAATLLSEKNLTISEVAYATGFSNLSHFSNSFHDFYGVSPSEYKCSPQGEAPIREN